MNQLPNQYPIDKQDFLTEVHLYSGVPWDLSYQHVRLYDSKYQLLTTLDSKYLVKSLSHVAQVKPSSMRIKIPSNEYYALHVNYLAYRTRGHEWIFAFVTGSNFLSNATTELQLEYDVFQNNIYDVTIKPSFIKMNHIFKREDTIFGNLQPVSLETNDYVVAEKDQINVGKNYIGVYTSGTATGEFEEGYMNNDIYNANNFTAFEVENQGAESVNAFVKAFNESGRIDNIVNMFMCPYLCVQNQYDNDHNIHYVDTDISLKPYLFEGYKPKNNKLYQYPFVYLLLDNNGGQTATYKFELDRSKEGLTLRTIGALNTQPTLATYPMNYGGIPNNYSQMLISTNMPNVAFNSDSYKAWLAQHSAVLQLGNMASQENYDFGMYETRKDMVGGVINTVGKVGGAIATGGLAGVGQAGMAGLEAFDTGKQIAHKQKQLAYQRQSFLAPIQDRSKMSNTCKGKGDATSVNYTLGLRSPTVYKMCIRGEQAKVIDDYFTQFGYPINRIQKINLHKRKSWDYLETDNIAIQGKMELAERSTLCQIFDSGVFIWHTDDLGNFALNND